MRNKNKILFYILEENRNGNCYTEVENETEFGYEGWCVYFKNKIEVRENVHIQVSYIERYPSKFDFTKDEKIARNFIL